MDERFSEMLIVGGHANSLGRVNDVIEIVLNGSSRLDELYDCLFNEDAWVRMRAADALEKICRKYPDWLLPYIDRFQKELADSTQPSIQWHLAQIYQQVALTSTQRSKAIEWLKGLLSSESVDWIVSANAMDTLAQFTKAGFFLESDLIPLINIQQHHKSKSVVRRADKIMAQFSS